MGYELANLISWLLLSPELQKHSFKLLTGLSTWISKRFCRPQTFQGELLISSHLCMFLVPTVLIEVSSSTQKPRHSPYFLPFPYRSHYIQQQSLVCSITEVDLIFIRVGSFLDGPQSFPLPGIHALCRPLPHCTVVGMDNQ